MRRLAVVAAVIGAGVLLATPVGAHPLGNFTVNTSSGLRVGPEQVAVDFVVDLAEIPTLQADQRIDRDGDGRTSAPEDRAYRREQCAAVAGGAALDVDGRAVRLEPVSTDLARRPGQAGLPTLRLTCELLARTGPLAGLHTISYRNGNFTDRIGWREVTAVGDRVTLLASDVPRESVSARLTRYPKDLLNGPLDQRSAELRVRPGGPAAGAPGTPRAPGAPGTPGARGPLPRGVDQATQAFTSFVSRQRLSLGFAALALLFSIVLGAIHALAPGHGKTVMAAYLVGERGSLREAVLIGLTVTATHTAGVLALGLAISASAVIAPERLYPWLGLASGLGIVAIGAGVLVRGVRRRRHRHSPHEHSHPPGHDHGHGPGERRSGALTRRDLLALGFIGGFLPSPSAVVVLLGAIALGRAWFGAALVLAYGVGMAATLTGTGLALIRARGALERRLARVPGPRLAGFSRLVPVVAAGLIMVVGCALTLRAAVQIAG